jgi:hypothetical protein
MRLDRERRDSRFQELGEKRGRLLVADLAGPRMPATARLPLRRATERARSALDRAAPPPLRFPLHREPISALRRHRRRFSPLVTILAYELLRWDRDAAPRFLSQSRGALPKSGATGAQSFFQYHAVFGFGAPPVLSGPAFQCLDNVLGNVSD